MKVLVIKPSSLGDIIHTLPAVRLIKKNYPDSHISWLIFDQFKQLADLFADVDELIVFKRYKWLTFRNLPEVLTFVWKLNRKYFDYVLDFQGLLRSGLFTFFANSPMKIGFSNAREFSSLFYRLKVTPPASAKHAVEKNISLVNKAFNFNDGYSSPRINLDRGLKNKVQGLLTKFQISDNEFRIAVAPVARWPSKTWPSFFFQM